MVSGTGDLVDHRFTFNQPENIDLIRKFRAVLDAYTQKDEYNPR